MKSEFVPTLLCLYVCVNIIEQSKHHNNIYDTFSQIVFAGIVPVH